MVVDQVDIIGIAVLKAVFDALKACRKLKAAGGEEAHAEAIVRSVAEAFEDTVATKSAIAAVKSDMVLKEARMLAAFSSAIKRMLIAQLAIAGLLFAALKLSHPSRYVTALDKQLDRPVA